MRSSRVGIAICTAALAFGSVAVLAPPAQASTEASDEIVRVRVLQSELGPWGTTRIATLECPLSHPWLVDQNLTGSRPGKYFKGVELIDPNNSIYMEMWKESAIADPGTQYVTGVRAPGGTINNANPFIKAAYEVWLSCTRTPEKYGFTPADGVLRTRS